MAPPPVNRLKRKALVERGGEPIRAPTAPQSNKNIEVSAKPSSIARPNQQLSHSSSVYSSRPPSAASSRNVFNGSFASSVGYSSQPTSSQSRRPHSAMGPSQSHRFQVALARPASSMEAHTSPSNGRVQGNRKGRTQFSSTLTKCPEQIMEFNGSPKVQKKPPSDWASIHCQAKSLRDISLSTAMSKLSLKNTSPAIELSDVSLALNRAQNVPIALNPQTPSHLPRPVPTAATPTQSPCPCKSPKKKNSYVYLNRHSNLSVPGFDDDDRVDSMEHSIKNFINDFIGAAKKSDGMKDVITMYKEASMSLQGLTCQTAIC